MSDFDDAFQNEQDEQFLRGLTGGPRASGFELQPLNLQQGGGVQLYGLAYPGFHGFVSWAYVTVMKGFVVLSQPGGGGAGTSLTNIWSERFFYRRMSPLQTEAAAGTGCRYTKVSPKDAREYFR
jgi:hypothetical protein